MIIKASNAARTRTLALDEVSNWAGAGVAIPGEALVESSRST